MPEQPRTKESPCFDSEHPPFPKVFPSFRSVPFYRLASALVFQFLDSTSKSVYVFRIVVLRSQAPAVFGKENKIKNRALSTNNHAIVERERERERERSLSPDRRDRSYDRQSLSPRRDSDKPLDSRDDLEP